ncbi:hypothetical protein AZE42_12681 [Rhizopogon vesiculosus]|uniref:Uncharacterized protein n=1 Tax=Rhizopogon vesiculosus TaxID=180088 RepID=A0A1J8QW71_9AGAM|nr:hypothetical protein AZE42_12681 [Rhizopogon vesiculosus]
MPFLHFSSSSFGRNLITVTTAENLGPEFSIETWLVADQSKGPLEDLVSSHDIQPLSAYDEKHVLIPPFQCESKLQGARRGAYGILPPSHQKDETGSMPKSPIKRPRLNLGPSAEQQRKKGKKNH